MTKKKHPKPAPFVRLLWGMLLLPDPSQDGKHEARLVFNAWSTVRTGPNFADGEPTRVLLFASRSAAHAFVRRRTEWKGRIRVVRVRERVEVAP